MAYWLAIIYFFVITYLLGETVAFFTKFSGKDLTEDIVMKIALGLAAFPLIVIVLNPLHLVTWWMILILSAIIPLYKIISSREEPGREGKKSKGFTFKKSHIYYALLAILFALHLYIYVSGAFAYPYLEDGDPLAHSLAAQYISDTHTFSVPEEFHPVAHYLEPYPPFYAAFMSIFVELSGFDMIWLLKFFNALLISLSVPFIYFAMKKLTGSNFKAISAAFLLLCINAYSGHFIFAASWATTMIIPGIYFLVHLTRREETESKKKDMLPWNKIMLAAIVFSSIFLIQPIAAGIFASFLGITFLLSLRDWSEAKNILAAIAIGLLLSQLFWIPALAKFGVSGVSETLGFQMFKNIEGVDVDSSGGVIYSFSDFLLAPDTNKIDNPVGVGAALFIAFIAAAIILLISIVKLWKTKDNAALAIFIWTLLLMLLIEGNAFPYKFTPHRLWAFFAIGVVLVTVGGICILLASIRNRYVNAGIIIALAILIVITGLIPKWIVQTSNWPPGPEWRSIEELQGYLQMKSELPAGTPVYSICSHDMKPASVNMRIKFLDQDLKRMKSNHAALSDDAFSFRQFFGSKGINYLVIDTECIASMGINETNELIMKMGSEGAQPVVANTGFFLAKLG